MRETRWENSSEQMVFELLEASARRTNACQISVRHTQLTEKLDHQDGNMESRSFKCVGVFNTLEVTRINLAGALSGQR